MQPPDEGCNPESDNSITVEIIEATERRPKRVALGFHNVDHHIDIEQAIAMANDILEKTGEPASVRQRLADQGRETRKWKERADCMVELVNAALAVADSIKLWEGGKTATASPPLCADLIELAAIYASKATDENDEFAPIDTPIQRIDEDRLSDILGDLIAKAAVPVFDEAFKARAETIVNLTMRSAGLLANLIAERLKRHGTE